MSVYDYKVKKMDGNEVSLSEYKGQALLIVNVASQCAYTDQYRGLEKLYEEFKDQGFTILGFPCNQFGDQEPGDESEIKKFCELKYDVKFPLFAKIDVNGKDEAPLYHYLKSKEKGFLGTKSIKWNFTKFLINKKGDVVKRYAPNTEPAKIKPEIQKLLK